MNNIEATAWTQRPAAHLDFFPAISSIAAALASLAFFRPWTVFLVNLGSSAPLSLSGAALARQYSAVWLIMTPAFLLVILLMSVVRMFASSFAVRSAFASIVVGLALPAVLWPAQAMGAISGRLSHLSTSGLVKMELTVWWWVYAAALAAAIVSAIIDFVVGVKLGQSAVGALAGQKSRSE